MRSRCLKQVSGSPVWIVPTAECVLMGPKVHIAPAKSHALDFYTESLFCSRLKTKFNRADRPKYTLSRNRMFRCNAQKPRDRPVIKRVSGGSGHLTVRRDLALRNRENSLSKRRIPKLVRASAVFNNAANQLSRECGRCFWGHRRSIRYAGFSMYTAASHSGVDGRAAGSIRIVLRSFAAIVHSIVSDNANPPKAYTVEQARSRILESLRRRAIPPCEHRHVIARGENGVENIPRKDANEGRKAQPPRGIHRIVHGLSAPRSLRIDQHHRSPLANLGFIETLFLKDVPLRNSRIVCDLTNAQMVIRQDCGPTTLLYAVVIHFRSPSNQGFFVAPTRKRENPTFAGE